MVATPPVTPSTLPAPSTLATPVALLLQVPPDGVADNAVPDPTHADNVPVIALGFGCTVTVLVVVFEQLPLVAVKEIVALPSAAPVTVAVEPAPATLAVPLALLLQAPVAALLVSVMFPPRHTLGPPDILPAAGNGSTVSTVVAAQPAMV